MNIKLHTPKSLKTGSGMGSLKQFLLSLFATTVSIALTFGTAAIIDYNKKQSEKHEIVMMVMYDMYNSLKSIEECDSAIQQSMLIQRQIAEDTTMFDELRFKMMVLAPWLEYTETTERIFSSSIETINTVGNVLFTENVADFYQCRQFYKKEISDSVLNRLRKDSPSTSLKDFLTFSFLTDAMYSNQLTKEMRHLFEQCQQLMNVTDEDIEAYKEKRTQLDNSDSYDNKIMDSTIIRLVTLQNGIDSAIVNLNLKQ